jgi:hypothetical protein
MGGTKQRLTERLKLARVLLNLRSEHVGEQVTAYVSQKLTIFRLNFWPVPWV